MPVIRPFRSLPPIARKEYNYDFVDYMWYNGLFNPEEVEKIRSIWKPELASEAKVNSGDKDLAKDKLRQSEIMFIKPVGNEWIYDRLSTACIQANTGRYKFDITGFQTELQMLFVDKNTVAIVCVQFQNAVHRACDGCLVTFAFGSNLLRERGGLGNAG